MRTTQGLSILLLLLGACNSDSGLDGEDPMQPVNGDGGIVTPCAGCFEGLCAWEASECASDPGCARWLTCARDCPSNDQGSPDMTCVGLCSEPESSTGRTLRDVFVGCLLSNPGCCSPSEVGDAAAGGDGFDGEDGSFDAANDASPPLYCPGETCEGCMLAIEAQDGCAPGDEACGVAIAECHHENDPEGPKHCWSYLTAYGSCAESAGEECVHALPEKSVELTFRALGCVTAYCPQCIADPERACLGCQLAACPDEMQALLASGDAQALSWCRSGCRTASDPAACRQACFEDHSDGTPIIIELYVCTQNACKAACEGM